MHSFPEKIMIEATNLCNNHCFFCGSMFTERKRGMMQPELMERLIKEAYQEGSRTISFHGTGEPFVCKDLENYIRLAKNTGYTYVYLDTNGSLATPDRARGVLDAGLDSIKFSLHATTRETYKAITGNDQYDVIMDNIRYMHEYIRENKIKCRMIAHFVLTKINEEELDEFRKKMGEITDDVWIEPVVNDGGVSDIEQYATTDSVATVKELPCAELFARMTINWDGTASACCMDWTQALVYGDAKTTPLRELWNSEALNSLRRQHGQMATLPDICRACMGAPQ